MAMTQAQITAELKRKAAAGIKPTSTANQAQYKEIVSSLASAAQGVKQPTTSPKPSVAPTPTPVVTPKPVATTTTPTPTATSKPVALTNEQKIEIARKALAGIPLTSPTAESQALYNTYKTTTTPTATAPAPVTPAPVKPVTPTTVAPVVQPTPQPVAPIKTEITNEQKIEIARKAAAGEPLTNPTPETLALYNSYKKPVTPTPTTPTTTPIPAVTPTPTTPTTTTGLTDIQKKEIARKAAAGEALTNPTAESQALYDSYKKAISLSTTPTATTPSNVPSSATTMDTKKQLMDETGIARLTEFGNLYAEAMKKGDRASAELAKQGAKSLRESYGLTASEDGSEWSKIDATKVDYGNYTPEEYNQIKKLQADYTYSKLKGDTAGMDAAHKAAVAIDEKKGLVRSAIGETTTPAVATEPVVTPKTTGSEDQFTQMLQLGLDTGVYTVDKNGNILDVSGNTVGKQDLQSGQVTFNLTQTPEQASGVVTTEMMDTDKATTDAINQIVGLLQGQIETPISLMSQEEAQKQAGEQINPLYQSAQQEALKAMNEDAIRRGMFGQLPQEALNLETSGKLNLQKASDIAELAQSLKASGLEQAQAVKSSKASDILNKLNAIVSGANISSSAKQAILNSLSNLAQTKATTEATKMESEKFAFDKKLAMANLLGYFEDESGKKTPTMAMSNFLEDQKMNKEQIKQANASISQGWSRIANDNASLAIAKTRLGMDQDQKAMDEKKFYMGVAEQAFNMTAQQLVPKFDQNYFDALKTTDLAKAKNYANSFQSSVPQDKWNEAYTKNIESLSSELGMGGNSLSKDLNK